MSATAWPTAPLGDVIAHRKNFIRVDDHQQYKRCRVQLSGRGIVLRDQVLGVDIKTKEQQPCRAGEMLVAEIDAKLGGFGIVPDDLEGAIVSSHYFLFTIDEHKLNRRFLGFYLQMPGFQEQVTARGSTNYAAIRPHHVLNYTIPLPPLEEQNRIVAKLDALAATIGEVEQTRAAMEQEAEASLRSAFSQLVGNAPLRRFDQVAPLVRRQVDIRMGEEYHELGIRSFGRGTFHKPPLDYMSVGNKKLFRIEPGDLVFNNVFAWEGAIAVATPADAGRFGSHRFLTCVPIEGIATSEFLAFYFLTAEGLAKIGEASPGGAGRNRTLGIERLAIIDVPLPSFGDQEWFGRLLGKTREIRETHSENQRDLTALLPSLLDRAFRGEM